MYCALQSRRFFNVSQSLKCKQIILDCLSFQSPQELDNCKPFQCMASKEVSNPLQVGHVPRDCPVR